MDIKTLFAVILFVVVYIIISTDRVHKTIIALFGASMFVLFHILPTENIFPSIDWNVIFLLIGMMIIVGIVKKSGLFQYVAIKTAKWANGNPVVILIGLSIITAVFSAFLDNVTTVLIIIPVTILIAVELGLPYIPFLLSEVMASNIGGTATLIGDPPNIMIGSAADMSFMDFIINMAPITVIILIAFSFIIYWFWGKDMHVTNERRARIMEFDETKIIEDKRSLVKSIVVLTLVFVGFIFHDQIDLDISGIAMIGASVLMILTERHKVDEFFHEVEWGTIFFFIGLFIMVEGLVHLGVIKFLAERLLEFTEGSVTKTSFLILWASGVFSAFIDNIPYVATMIPLIGHIGNQFADPSSINALWWSLALGACLGGNATIIGASANVIAAGMSEKQGHKITFFEFAKYGVVVTFVSLLISSVYVYFRYLR